MPNVSCFSTLPVTRAPGTMAFCAEAVPPAFAAPSWTSATPMRFFSGSMLRISNGAVIPTATALAHPSDRPVGANVDACASPSMPGCNSTKAPNSARRVTRPVSTWPTWYADSIVDHGSALSCFNPSEIFCPSSSTRSTLTVISWPGERNGDGSATRDHAISETWSRPCTPAPRSMNAPKSRTDTTRPVSTAPATMALRISAAPAFCSSSSSARRERTRSLPPSLYSMMRNV